MGIFSQDTTKTEQTAYNQQVGVSNRDLSGSQVTGAAGANTAGFLAVGPGSNANVTVNSLDNTALQTAAFTINHALDTNAALAQSTLTGFQNALTANSEHPVDQGGTGLSPVTDNATLQPHHIDWITIAAIVTVGGFILYSLKKGR